MDNTTLYNLAKTLAAVLAVASAMIAAASNLPDLGLSKQALAVLTVCQAGIAATLAFLPAVQHSAGDVRGAGGEH